MPVLVFGSVNADLVFAVPELPAHGRTVLGEAYRALPGGKGANQAVAAARDGAKVALAGAVGRDPLADVALSAARAAGVDLSRVAATGVPTGCAAICVDPAGRNQIAVAAGANALARAAQVEDAALGPDVVVVVQMEVPLAETASLVARAWARGARTVLNLAPAGPLPGGAPGVAVTRGEAGAEAATAAGTLRAPAFPAAAIDTTGAGDCWCGVLAAALDAGAPLERAMLRAAAAAAIACTRPGAAAAMPEAGETDALLASSP